MTSDDKPWHNKYQFWRKSRSESPKHNARANNVNRGRLNDLYRSICDLAISTTEVKSHNTVLSFRFVADSEYLACFYTEGGRFSGHRYLPGDISIFNKSGFKSIIRGKLDNKFKDVIMDFIRKKMEQLIAL